MTSQCYADVKLGVDLAVAVVDKMMREGYGNRSLAECVEPFKDTVQLALREIEES